MEGDLAHVGQLWTRALEAIGGEWRLNRSADARYRGNLNLLLPGEDAARLTSDVRRAAFSAASACASGSCRRRHVLSELGLSGAESGTSIIIGCGCYDPCVGTDNDITPKTE